MTVIHVTLPETKIFAPKNSGFQVRNLQTSRASFSGASCSFQGGYILPRRTLLNQRSRPAGVDPVMTIQWLFH